MTAITDIEGIGPAMAEKLGKAGATSVEKLLELGATSKGRNTLIEQSGLGKAHVLKFVNHADLFRVKGVGGEYAELLEAAGVDTVPELAQRNAANLAAKMAEVNAAKKLVRSVPSETVVTKWVAQAKEMDRVISH